ncbi:hypothetical protein Tco_0781866, partial [Tanacetum coccineum]
MDAIVTASGQGFDDWQWRLATLRFAFGGLGVYSAGDVLNYAFLASRLQSASLQTKLLRHTSIVSPGPIFDEALSVFNTSMETDLLKSTFSLSPRQMDLWTSQMEDHTSDWLRTVPISGLGQTINGKTYRYFVPGQAVIDVARCKHGMYMAKCATIGYGFLPFSFSSLGELEADAVTLLKRIRKFSMTQDIGARAAVHIFNRISFAIAKG